ncbi:PadR family transcriptional regulator [Natronoglycomyces albus]|uniref:PadR family transcriptional regulator n=1 Tax=Natronoglycomyces albus TaxID=2811108 RepID=A0A895XLW4_9ACTN|nr:PadR family transcriptional regulator [Natronoglycomyces albus]QSB04772.1 PadR family transcriptional regulator [Natronoglycomyces albus]
MSLRHAILGILSIEPMSGYDLKKVIDESVGHFWSADQSQIYRTLNALVEDNLATRRTVVQEERPNQHIHRPTDLGLAELEQWLRSPIQMGPSREPFLARLFFADRLPAADIAELLEAHHQEVLQRLAVLEAINVPDQPGDLGHVLRMATLANGITHAKAELAWIENTKRDVERIYP